MAQGTHRLLGFQFVYPMGSHPDRPAVDRHQAVDAAQNGGFSGSRRADDADGLALFDGPRSNKDMIVSPGKELGGELEANATVG